MPAPGAVAFTPKQSPPPPLPPPPPTQSPPKELQRYVQAPPPAPMCPPNKPTTPTPPYSQATSFTASSTAYAVSSTAYAVSSTAVQLPLRLMQFPWPFVAPAPSSPAAAPVLPPKRDPTPPPPPDQLSPPSDRTCRDPVEEDQDRTVKERASILSKLTMNELPPKEEQRDSVEEDQDCTPWSPRSFFDPTPTASDAGVYFSVDVPDADIAEGIINYCKDKKLRAPSIRMMQPFARQRAPLPNKTDNYMPVDERVQRKIWHPKGGPPHAKPKLSEDYHFLMRCLHSHLPMPAVESRVATDEGRFAQQYGIKFGKFAENRGYVRLLNGEKRLQKDHAFNALHKWLTEKVIGQTAPFGWEGYSLTEQQILEVSSGASKDWVDGWLS